MTIHRQDLTPAAVIALYRKHKTIPRTAAAAGVSERTISRRLKEGGVFAGQLPSPTSRADLRAARGRVTLLQRRLALVAKDADDTLAAIDEILDWPGA